MNANIPASSQPLIEIIFENGKPKVVNNTSWYRYFSQNDAAQIAVLRETIATMQATIETQAEQITALNAGMSVVRDVAQINTLTSAAEIPDLGRR